MRTVNSVTVNSTITTPTTATTGGRTTVNLQHIGYVLDCKGPEMHCTTQRWRKHRGTGGKCPQRFSSLVFIMHACGIAKVAITAWIILTLLKTTIAIFSVLPYTFTECLRTNYFLLPRFTRAGGGTSPSRTVPLTVALQPCGLSTISSVPPPPNEIILLHPCIILTPHQEWAVCASFV